MRLGYTCFLVSSLVFAVACGSKDDNNNDRTNDISEEPTSNETTLKQGAVGGALLLANDKITTSTNVPNPTVAFRLHGLYEPENCPTDTFANYWNSVDCNPDDSNPDGNAVPAPDITSGQYLFNNLHEKFFRENVNQDEVEKTPYSILTKYKEQSKILCVVDAALTTLDVTTTNANWITDSLREPLAEKCEISLNYVNKVGSHAVEQVTDADSVYTHKFSFQVDDYTQEMRFGLVDGETFHFAFASSPSSRGLLKFNKTTGETAFEYINTALNATNLDSHVHFMRLYVEPTADGGKSTILFSKTNGGAAVVLGKVGEAGALNVALINSAGTSRDGYASRKEVKGCIDGMAGTPSECDGSLLVSQYGAFSKLDGHVEGKDILELYSADWHLLNTNPVPNFSTRDDALELGFDEIL